jgi:SAM-dependent methyltransferase
MNNKDTQQRIAEILDPADETKQLWDNLAPTDADYMMHSPKPIGYHETNEQLFLFQNLLAGFNPQINSILDIGCGRADLARFIADFYDTTPVYTGIDHNPIMTTLALEKHGQQVITGAFESVSLPTADWVVASGVFTQRRCETEDQDLQKLFNDIAILYNTANNAVAFNLLSPINTQHHQGFFYVHPGLIMDMLIEKYQSVIVRHNYSKDVYTVTIYKI